MTGRRSLGSTFLAHSASGGLVLSAQSLLGAYTCLIHGYLHLSVHQSPRQGRRRPHAFTQSLCNVPVSRCRWECSGSWSARGGAGASAFGKYWMRHGFFRHGLSRDAGAPAWSARSERVRG